MSQIVRELPTVLTCYGYRPEYVAELEGMLATVRAHHPDWPLVIGRGPVAGCERPTLEVESPTGKCRWTLPVPFNFDGSETDFLKIVWMKAWWMLQVWHHFGDLAGAPRRLVWTDADARFNGPLDIKLEPDTEVVAGPWWYDPEQSGLDHICTGLLLFQGVKRGTVERILEQWSSRCVSHIRRPPPQTKPWPDDEQVVLTDVLKSFSEANADYELLKLEAEKYIGLPTDGGKELVGRGLIDHWYMSAKMRLPEHRDRNWPPPESYRRQAPIGTPIPDVNWKRPDDDSPDGAG